MTRSRSKSLPSFESLDDLVEFFDAHDMGDYWEQLPEAHFDINIRTKKHVDCSGTSDGAHAAGD
jgi:hypothetical protein